MSFQSPPFWCLMTTLQEFAKVRDTPPRCVHDLCVCLWNATYTPFGFNTPPQLYKFASICNIYEYNQDKANARWCGAQDVV